MPLSFDCLLQKRALILTGRKENKEQYTIWERSNLLMLYKVMVLSKEDLPHIALWNGVCTK